METVVIAPEPENLKISEECSCKGCGLEMTEQEVYFKDGLVQMSREQKTEGEVENWCRKCVDGSALLTHKSNDMIRHFVYLLLRDSDKETRELMKEEIKTLRPDDYELVKDMFEVENFYEMVSMKEEDVVAELKEVDVVAEEGSSPIELKDAPLPKVII